MSPLDTLLAWARTMAETDPDGAARPLWGQIAREVAGYLGDGLIAQDEPVGPDLFSGDA